MKYQSSNVSVFPKCVFRCCATQTERICIIFEHILRENKFTADIGTCRIIVPPPLGGESSRQLFRARTLETFRWMIFLMTSTNFSTNQIAHFAFRSTSLHIDHLQKHEQTTRKQRKRVGNFLRRTCTTTESTFRRVPGDGCTPVTECVHALKFTRQKTELCRMSTQN